MEHNETTITSEDKTQTIEEIIAEDTPEVTAETASEERPEWLPEKFKSAEDLAEAYRQLEQKQSQGEASAEEETSALAITPTQAEEAVESAGLDFEGLLQKYQENDTLEDSDYEALENAGLSRDIVDGYIKGQQALIARYEDSVLEQFGDAEEYKSMVSWAAENLSEDKIDLFNEAVHSGNIEKAMFAIDGLKSQYESANGREPGRTVDGRPSTSGPTFTSENEMVTAMQDPRYWSDVAYREAIDRKFANTWGAS